MQISNNFRQSTPAFGQYIPYVSTMNQHQKFLSSDLEELLEYNGAIEQLDNNTVDIVAFSNSPENADKFDDGISVFFVDSFNGQAYRTQRSQMYSYSFDRNKLDSVAKSIKKLADKIASGKITAPAYDEEKLVTGKTDLDKLERKLAPGDDYEELSQKQRHFDILDYGDDYYDL